MKTVLTFDMKRYDCRKHDEYVEITKKIFFHRNIRLIEEKIELIQELCNSLPIVLIGNARDVKIRSIINIVNMLLFVKNDEINALAYTTKKARVVKNKQEHYVNMYSFYFVSSGDNK